MTIRQMKTVFDHEKQTVDVYVLSVGVVEDCAVYMKTYTLREMERPLTAIALQTSSTGLKLTEKDALEIMHLPSGLHYRR